MYRTYMLNTIQPDEKNKDLNRHIMCMDCKTQHSRDGNYPHIDKEVLHNSYHHPSQDFL